MSTIQLRTLLQELKYGNRLLDDPQQLQNIIAKANPWQTMDIRSIDPLELEKFKILGIEKNTKDEALLLTHLTSFLTGDMYKLPGGWKKVLEELLALKSKFPEILDPLSYAGGRSITDLEYVYRGATIPIDLFLQLDWERSTHGVKADYSGKALTPRSRRGAHSFSAEPNVAIRFARRNYDTSPERKSFISCIIAIPRADSNLLFNPKFLNLFMDVVGQAEYESIYVGDQITPDHIIFPKGLVYVYAEGGFSSLEYKYQDGMKKLLRQFEKMLSIKIVNRWLHM